MNVTAIASTSSSCHAGRECFDLARIRRDQHIAARIHSLLDLEAQMARNQRRIARIVEIERDRPRGAADLQHIAEAGCGDDRGSGAPAFQQAC